MRAPLLPALALALVLGPVLVGCGGSTPTSGTPIEVDGADALRWGDGSHGVVLAHGASFDAASWEDEATAIAAAVATLRDDGAGDVALVGGSAGADAILDLESAQPGLSDRLVLFSPNAVVTGLGAQPKLFVASREEPVADVSVELARDAPGGENQVELLPGSAHAQGIFDSDQGERALELLLEALRPSP